MNHPSELLPGYAGGWLPPDQADAVAAHLAGCAACAAEVAGWGTVARAAQLRAATVAPPPSTLFAAIQARLAAPGRYAAAIGHRPVVRGLRLLLRQPRLIGWPAWVVSALLLTGGTALAAAAPPGAAGQLLAMVVPLAAASLVAAACGRDTDPAAEILAASPTPLRTVLLARLTLVLAAVFLAAGAASGVLVGVRGGAAAGVLAGWLGPMVLLAAVTFALSVVWRPAPAVWVAVALWAAQLLARLGLLDHHVAALVSAVWSTNVPVLVVAAALIGGAVVLAPWTAARPAVRFGR